MRYLRELSTCAAAAVVFTGVHSSHAASRAHRRSAVPARAQVKPIAAAAAPKLQRPLLRITTQRYDIARTGQDLAETILTPKTVSANTFGKLFTREVDGYIYAQPLYIEGLKIGKSLRNVVYVATQHNSVYAFDADDPKASEPLWHVNFGPSVPSHDLDGGPWGDYNDIWPEIGITSTPVIDLETQSIFVVSKTKVNGQYAYNLHVLDIITGKERKNSPVLINPTADGTGDGAVNGKVPFDSLKELQRAALLLVNGIVYIAFASHADFPPFHGWVLGYDAKTFERRGVFNTSPNGSGDGIWQSGGGLSSDGSGDFFAVTGNGTFDADTKGPDYGNCVMRFHPTSKGLTVTDWFAPYNQTDLTAGDHDLGSSCPLYIPDLNRIVAGGKGKVIYVLDAAKLGKFNPSGDTQIVQSFQGVTGHIHGAPIYWHGETGPRIYIWSEYDHLKAYPYKAGQFDTTPSSMSPDVVPDGMPGGFLTISANKNKKGSGIVWASRPYLADANRQTVAGLFQAYDAEDLSKVLWSSEDNPDRDRVGMFAKFNPPTVANGKVYLGTFSGELVVYGLHPPASTPDVPAPPANAPAPDAPVAPGPNAPAPGP